MQTFGNIAYSMQSNFYALSARRAKHCVCSGLDDQLPIDYTHLSVDSEPRVLERRLQDKWFEMRFPQERRSDWALCGASEVIGRTLMPIQPAEAKATS